LTDAKVSNEQKVPISDKQTNFPAKPSAPIKCDRKRNAVSQPFIENLKINIMTPERWNEVKEIFNAVVDLSSDERAQFLDDRTNGDAELRRAIERLLASDEKAETLFDGVSLIAPPELPSTATVGNYQIVKKIGEGGMGTVFLALRADLKQKVALKSSGTAPRPTLS
jgi:hypothetical protein